MRYLPVAMMLFAAVACSKVESRDVTLLSNELNVDGGCEIYTVEHAEAAAWSVAEAPAWITPVKLSGNAGEPLELYVESNGQPETRSGIVQVAYANGTSRDVAVTQTDAQPEVNLQRTYAVGWGFDVTTYRDSRGVKDQIFNTQKVLNYRQNSLTNTPSTHTSVVMSYGESYEELNESLKVNLKLDLNISAFKLNLNGTFGKNTLGSSKRVFSWMRGIYEQRLVRMNVTPIAAQNNSLFTQDFAEERQRVIDAGGSDASIRQLLSRYGTHYVTTSTLGGYLDYYFSSSVDKISDTLDVDATIGFGYATTFNLNADVKYKDAFESFGEDKIESFLVKGGDAITLTNAVVAKTINNAALDAWLASFGGVEDDQGRLELINFEVNGIYELFPSDIKTKIRNYIERVMYYNDLPVTRSGNQDSFQN